MTRGGFGGAAAGRQGHREAAASAASRAVLDLVNRLIMFFLLCILILDGLNESEGGPDGAAPLEKPLFKAVDEAVQQDAGQHKHQDVSSPA